MKQPKHKGLRYGINYKRQATQDVPLDEQADDKGIGYGFNYKRQATQDMPLDEREKEEYKRKTKDFVTELTTNVKQHKICH